MPKNRIVKKVDGRTISKRAPSKMRIGTRKAGKSANLMSNAELQAVLDSGDKRKWHHVAKAVLDARQ